MNLHEEIRKTIKLAYNSGYANGQSEVAREIFEEIEELITNQCLILKDERGVEGYVKASVHYALAELKKKYTKEGEDKE